MDYLGMSQLWSPEVSMLKHALIEEANQYVSTSPPDIDRRVHRVRNIIGLRIRP